VKRQLTKQPIPQTSDWIWVTTLSLLQARTALVVALGHQRWDIENYGFNELVNGWYADHVYRHDPNAIEGFLLLAFLAYNTFHAFLALHLKPQLRAGKTEVYWARLMAAAIYAEMDCSIAGSSPGSPCLALQPFFHPVVFSSLQHWCLPPCREPRSQVPLRPLPEVPSPLRNSFACTKPSQPLLSNYFPPLPNGGCGIAALDAQNYTPGKESVRIRNSRSGGAAPEARVPKVTECPFC